MSDIVESNSSSLHHSAETRLPQKLRGETLVEAKRVFQEVYDSYKNEVVDANHLEDKARNPDTLQLMTPKEKRQLSDYYNISVVMDIAHNGKKEFELPGLEFGNDSKSFENIPVEGLFEFLNEKISKIRKQIDEVNNTTPEGRKELNRLKNELDIQRNSRSILRHHSRGLLDLPHGKEPPVEGSFAFKRIQWEAYMISQDPLRASTNPNPEQRMKEDWLNASKALDRRRILIDPPQEGNRIDLTPSYEDRDPGIVYKTKDERQIMGDEEDNETGTRGESEEISVSGADRYADEHNDDDEPDDTDTTAVHTGTPTRSVTSSASGTTTSSTAAVTAPSPIVSPTVGVSPAVSATSPTASVPASTVAPSSGGALVPAPVTSSSAPSSASSETSVREVSTRELEETEEPEPSEIVTRPITQNERTSFSAVLMSRTEEMRKRARIMAVDQVNKELSQGKWWNPRDIFRKMQVRWGEDYYTTKYTELVMDAMIKNNTSLLEYDFSKQPHEAVSKVNENRENERLTGQKKLESIEILSHEDESRRLGQKIVDLDKGDEADKKLKTSLLNEVLRPLGKRLGVGGDLAGASQEKKEEEMQKILREYVGVKLNSQDVADADVRSKVEEFFGKDAKMHTADSLYFASGLLDMTESILRERSVVEFANGSLDEIISLKIAESTWVQGTDYQYKNTDKIFHWAKSHKLPLTPATMAATFAIVTGVGAILTKSQIRHWVAPVIGTVVGAATSMLRKKEEENKDMTKYRIDNALGKVLNPDNKKQKEYERMSYNIKNYEDLLNGIPRDPETPQTPEFEYEQKGFDQMLLELRTEVGNDYNNTKAQTLLLRRIGEMQARLELSMRIIDTNTNGTNDRVKERNDFIRFNDKTIDQDRAHLMLEYVEKRMEMTKTINEQIRIQMKNAGASDADIEAKIADKAKELTDSEDSWRQSYIEDLLKDKAAKDREFNVHKLVKSVKAAGFGSVTGLFTGMLVKEGLLEIDRGAASGVEVMANLGHDHLGLNDTGLIHNIQDYKHSLDGQGIIDRWNSIKSTDKFQDVLAKLSGVSPVEHLGSSEQFTGLYNHPGTVELGNHYQVASNANHELSFFDTSSNKPVGIPLHGTIDQAGIMHVIGDKANLGTDIPVDLRQELTQGNFDIKPGDYHHETIFGGPKDPIYDPTHPENTSALGSIKATEHASVLGHDVLIPKGTEFRQDPSGFMDLVIKDPNPAIDGTVIMNDVQFKPDGTLFYDDANSAFKMSEINLIDSQHTIDPETMRKELSTHVTFEGYSYNLHDQQWDPTLKENIAVGHRVELKFGDEALDNGTKFHAYMLPTNDVSIQNGIVPSHLDIKEYFKPQYSGEHAAWSLIHPTGDGREDIIAIRATDSGDITFDVNDHDPTHVFHIYDPVTNDYTKEVQVGEFSRMWINHHELSQFSAQSQVGRNYGLMNIGNGSAKGYGMFSAGQMVLEDKSGIPVKIENGTFLHYDGSPVEDQSGIHHVWKSVGASIFDGKATPIQEGGKIPEINGHRIDELYKTWDIIPPHEIIDWPLIPLPWDPRDPLRRLRTEVLLYYPEGIYPTNTRLKDIMRSSDARGNQNTYIVSRPIINPQESQEAIRKAKEAFDKTDEINIVMGGAIGDAVLTTAYLRAIQNAISQFRPPRTININLFVSNEQEKLFDNLVTGDPNIKITKIPRNKEFDEIRDESISKTSATNPIFLQFQHFNKDNPVVESTTSNGKNITAIWNLLTPGVELYNNQNDNERRYAKYIEDLFSLPANSIDQNVAQPLIKLPSDEANIYDTLASKFSIDKTKPQIAIIIEGNGIMMGKRYKIDNWAEVISELASSNPNFEFNIVYNPANAPAGYTQTDIESALTKAGVEGKTHLVNGTLSQMAVFLKHQSLVLANDTGLGHVASAVEGGPKVGTIFGPKGLPKPKSWKSSKRQHAIIYQGNVDSLPDVDATVADENLKTINRIPPSYVARRALEILSTP